MRLREQIAGAGLLFSASTFLSLGLTFAATLVVARYLGPSAFGVWVLLQVILQYAQWAQLSTHNALNREIPRLRGTGDLSRLGRICQVGWTMTVWPSALIGVALLGFSLAAPGLDDLTRMGLRYLAFLVVLRQIYNYLINLYKANSDFTLASAFQGAYGLANFILCIPLTIWAGFHGLMLGQVAATAICLAYGYWRRPWQLRFTLNLAELWGLMKIGFPIWLAGVVYQLLITADRTLIASMLGATWLGYYGAALTLRGVIMVAPSSVSQVVYPRMAERYGATGDVLALRNYVILPNLVQAYLMPVFIGAAWVAWPLVMRVLLPQYLAGLLPAQIVTLSVFFFSLCGAGDFLNSIDKQYPYVLILAMVTALTWVGTWFILRTGLGLVGVASVTLVSGFVFATLLNAYACRLLRLKVIEVLQLLSKMYLPFAYLVFLVGGLDYLISLPEDLFLLAAITILKLAIFGLASLPLLFRAESETSVVSCVQHHVATRLLSLRSLLSRLPPGPAKAKPDGRRPP